MTSPRLHAFPPVVSARSRVLVLGSMPGAASLAAGEYYAHPRNAFWPIMQTVLGFPPGLPYPQRLAQLEQGGIALWDVAASCERPGSLDTAIRHDTVVANDIAALLAQYPAITLLCCNGQSVANLFRRHVLAAQTLPPSVKVAVLPSTSPANARMTVADKTRIWMGEISPKSGGRIKTDAAPTFPRYNPTHD